MNTSQDVNPLDNFFRNTLESLPETPGESGWDQPSDRVWQQVQAGIKAPQSGWSLKTWALVGLGTGLLLTALYFMVGQKPQPVPAPQNVTAPLPHSTATEAPAALPESATAPKSAETPGTVAEPAKKAAKPSNPKASATKTANDPDNVSPAPDNTGRVRPNSSTPLPGSKDVPHNTREANEQQKKGKEGGGF